MTGGRSGPLIEAIDEAKAKLLQGDQGRARALTWFLYCCRSLRSSSASTPAVKRLDCAEATSYSTSRDNNPPANSPCVARWSGTGDDQSSREIGSCFASGPTSNMTPRAICGMQPSCGDPVGPARPNDLSKTGSRILRSSPATSGAAACRSVAGSLGLLYSPTLSNAICELKAALAPSQQSRPRRCPRLIARTARRAGNQSLRSAQGDGTPGPRPGGCDEATRLMARWCRTPLTPASTGSFQHVLADPANTFIYPDGDGSASPFSR